MSDIDRLLSLTSRTFALSIPRLPEPLRRQVGVGYLIFRIADTIEDEGHASPAQRVEALHQFKQLIEIRDYLSIDQLLIHWNTHHRPDDPGYAELLDHGSLVCEQLDQLSSTAAGYIKQYVGRTIDGMAERLLAPTDITDIEGVRRYCYHVAGIVGEMLTDLFVTHHPPLQPHREKLMELSSCFGEALQLVNILRDHGIDLDAGRRYVPDEQAYADLLKLAEQDITDSHGYLGVLAAANAPAGMAEFNAFNLHLAEATLGILRIQGPGAKVSRDVVADTLKTIESTD